MALSELSITVPRVAFFVALITSYTLATECCRSDQSPSVLSEVKSSGRLTPLAQIAYGVHPVLVGDTSYRELRTDVESSLPGMMTRRLELRYDR
jgi:hypothetical protein